MLHRWVTSWRDRRRPPARSPWARPEWLRLGVVGPGSAVTELEHAVRSRAGADEWLVTPLDHILDRSQPTCDAVVIVDPAAGEPSPGVHPALAWLRQRRSTGEDVVRMLGSGFDAVVAGGEAVAVLAHLDALVRRPPPLASPAVRAAAAARSRDHDRGRDQKDR